MTSLAKIDPFLYGYFSDESLEICERVGLALLHASKNLEIKFSRQLLPETAFVTASGSSGYSPSDGLWFSDEIILKLAEEKLGKSVPDSIQRIYDEIKRQVEEQ